MAKLFRIATVPISLNALLKDQLKYLSQHYEVTAISDSGEDLDEVAEREGIHTKAIRMERKISPARDFISLWNLYWYFRREKPDIVHSITPKAGLLSMIAAKYAGVPVRMHTFTGLIFPYRSGSLQKLLIAMDRLLCLHATHIFPEGEGVKKDLERFRITSKPLKIIANGNVNGLDLQYYSANAVSDETKNNLRKQLNINSEDFVFIFVGRIVKDKGINELVSAFKRISEEHDHVRLILVGNFEHDLDPLLPATLQEIGRNKNIHAVGFQKDVRAYFGISNMLVFPSYREGFPNVVLQALAKEVPAIVTDISGCNEIVTHNVNGLLVKPKNAESLYYAMNLILADETRYNDLKNQVRESILKYDRDLVWKALLNEYNSALPNIHHKKAIPGF